jgi:hypothetical protein
VDGRGGGWFELCLYPNTSKGLTLFLKGLLTVMRVLPATLPRNRYDATKLDLRGMPNLVKTPLGGYWRLYPFDYNKLRQPTPDPNRRQVWS